MKGNFKKTALGLVPVSEEAIKLFNRMLVSEECSVTHTKGHDYKNISKFHKMAADLFHYQNDHADSEQWRKQLLIIAGHYDEVITPAPEWLEWVLNHLDKNLDSPHKEKILDQLRYKFIIQKWAKSIAMEKLTDEEFRKLFKTALTGYSKYYAKEGGIPDEKFLEMLKYCN